MGDSTPRQIFRRPPSLVWEGVAGWDYSEKTEQISTPPTPNPTSLTSVRSDSGLNSLEYWDYSVELDCLTGPQDLQLAAELGKTLLERNRELENSIKHHQAVIEDQGQEIEYLTKQAAALREVNESRVRVYEQLEISLHEAESLNSRLLEEAASDKARIKSLTGIVENLEQKCEELQLVIQESKRKVENEEGRKKRERKRSEGKETGSRKPSASIQQPPWPENECEAATSIPVTSEPARLPDMTSQELPAAAPLSSSEQPPVRGGSVSGQSSLESQEERCLELELVEVSSELERLRDLRKEDTARILELEAQVGRLVYENSGLSEAGATIGSVEPNHRTNSLVGSVSSCLCAEVLKADCAKQMKKGGDLLSSTSAKTVHKDNNSAKSTAALTPSVHSDSNGTALVDSSTIVPDTDSVRGSISLPEPSADIACVGLPGAQLVPVASEQEGHQHHHDTVDAVDLPTAAGGPEQAQDQPHQSLSVEGSALEREDSAEATVGETIGMLIDNVVTAATNSFYSKSGGESKMHWSTVVHQYISRAVTTHYPRSPGWLDTLFVSSILSALVILALSTLTSLFQPS